MPVTLAQPDSTPGDKAHKAIYISSVAARKAASVPENTTRPVKSLARRCGRAEDWTARVGSRAFSSLNFAIWLMQRITAPNQNVPETSRSLMAGHHGHGPGSREPRHFLGQLPFGHCWDKA